MVARTFFAHDNDSLVVTSSSSPGIVGNGIINNSSTPDGTIFLYSSGSGVEVTVDDTGGDPDVFEDDNAANHVIIDGGGLVADGQTAEAESVIEVRAFVGGVPTGPVITITVFSQGGLFSDVWGMSSDAALVDGVSYIKTNGSNAGSSTYTDFVTCFAEGTPIDTPDGPQLIDSLKSGDLVVTRDNGPLPVRWRGHRRVLGRGRLAPIQIGAGILGNSEVLLVSAEHRMFLKGPVIELLFGISCVLVAAKHLVGLAGIKQEDVGEVCYHHILFDTHQIIRSAGCWSESFFFAENAMPGLDIDARREMQALFPEIKAAEVEFGDTAYTVLKKHEALLLVAALSESSKANSGLEFAA